MYKEKIVKGFPNNGEVLLEDEYGGSYTLKTDDGCIILVNNNNGEYSTHFFREAISAIKKYWNLESLKK